MARVMRLTLTFVVALVLLSALTSSDQLTPGLFNYLAGQQPPDNILLSPLSIEVALSMLYHGTANGSESRRQLEAALSQNSFSGKFIASDLIEAAKGLQASQRRLAANNVTLQLGSGLFLNRNFRAKANYTTLLTTTYKASLEQLNGSNSDKVVFVNEWVKNRTGGLIPRLLSDGAISEDTAALLLNAVYFKGNWARPFKKEMTSVRRFHLDTNSSKVNNNSSAGTYVETDFMVQEGRVLLADEPGRMRVVSLPYTSPGTSMLVILPAENVSINELAADLFGGRPASLLQGAREVNLRLYLPKFKLGSKVSLKPALESLGVRDIFDSKTAALSEISDIPLEVGEILHGVQVEVNEEGTEAAAITSIEIDIRVAVSGPRELVFDRPFLFAIVDENSTSSLPLFAGKIMDPTGGSGQRHDLEPEKEGDVLLQARLLQQAEAHQQAEVKKED